MTDDMIAGIFSSEVVEGSKINASSYIKQSPFGALVQVEACFEVARPDVSRGP